MGWVDDQKILQTLNLVLAKQKQAEVTIAEMGAKFRTLVDTIEDLNNNQRRCCRTLNEKIDDIIKVLLPPPAVKLVVSILDINATQGEIAMAKLQKATIDFQLLDNGTAMATATPVDAAGLATTLPAGSAPATWVSSDPGVLVAANTADPTGLTATISPASPPVLVTGAVVTVTCVVSPTLTITGSGNPIDVVAGPAGSFAVAEQ